MSITQRISSYDRTHVFDQTRALFNKPTSSKNILGKAVQQVSYKVQAAAYAVLAVISYVAKTIANGVIKLMNRVIDYKNGLVIKSREQAKEAKMKPFNDAKAKLDAFFRKEFPLETEASEFQAKIRKACARDNARAAELNKTVLNKRTELPESTVIADVQAFAKEHVERQNMRQAQRKLGEKVFADINEGNFNLKAVNPASEQSEVVEDEKALSEISSKAPSEAGSEAPSKASSKAPSEAGSENSAAKLVEEGHVAQVRRMFSQGSAFFSRIIGAK